MATGSSHAASASRSLRACRPGRGGAECSLGARVRLEGGGPAPLGARPSSGGEGEPRAVADQGGRQELQAQARSTGDLLAPIADQAGDGRPVLGPAVADECLGQGAAALQEVRRALVTPPGLGLADLLDEHPVQVRAEHLVVPERPLALVDGDGEQLAARELLEQQRAPPPVQQLVAQVARQANEDARVDEEAPQLVGQLGQDVAGEVVAQEPGARADAAEDPPPLVRRLAARREVEQLQAGRPALRPTREDGQLARRHRIAVEVAEQPLDLPRPEAEVVALDLEEVARDAQARQVEVRPDARRGEDPEPRRRVVDQPAEHRLRGRALERVQVVDDQRRRPAGPRLQRPGRILHVVPARRQAGQRGTEGGLEMAEHPDRVVVPRLRPVPGHGQPGRGGESGEERRLAGARRRDDEGQPVALNRRRELGFEALPRECLGGRDADLGGHDRGRGSTRRHRASGTLIVPLLWQRLAPWRCRRLDGKGSYGATLDPAGSSGSAPGWSQVGAVCGRERSWCVLVGADRG